MGRFTRALHQGSEPLTWSGHEPTLKKGEQVFHFGDTTVSLNLGVWPKSKNVEVEWIQSRPKGTGAGTQVLKSVIQQSLSKGYRVSLYPDPDLEEDEVERLINFYKKLGFKMVPSDVGPVQMEIKPPSFLESQDQYPDLEKKLSLLSYHTLQALHQDIRDKLWGSPWNDDDVFWAWTETKNGDRDNFLKLPVKGNTKKSVAKAAAKKYGEAPTDFVVIRTNKRSKPRGFS